MPTKIPSSLPQKDSCVGNSDDIDHNHEQQGINDALSVPLNSLSEDSNDDSPRSIGLPQPGDDPRLYPVPSRIPSQPLSQIHDTEKLLDSIKDLKQKLERTTRELHEAQQLSLRASVYQRDVELCRSKSHEPESPAAQDNTRKSHWNNEIKRWKRVTNRYGNTEIYKASEKIEDVRARSSGYVLTVYDEYDHEGNRTHVSLEINSAPLLELLRKVITYYPGDEFDTLRGLEATGDTVTFTDPSMILFTYRKQLQQSLNDCHPENAKEHLKMLLDFMRTEHPKFSLKLEEIEEGRCQKIGFNYLWLLYPPNTTVYVGKGGVDRQMVVYSRASYVYLQVLHPHFIL